MFCTKLFAPLYEVANRPDLQWLCASAYYILAVITPSGEELDAAATACISAVWCITDCFDDISMAVAAAGISLVPTRLGECDLLDGTARATCCQLDKLLLLLVLLFGAAFEWIDGAPPTAPEPVREFVDTLRNWTGRRFPLAHF